MSEIIDQKQAMLLNLVLGNSEIFARCCKIMKPEYFHQPLDRVVDFVKTYFSTNHGIPEADVIFGSTGVQLAPRKLQSHEVDFTLDEIEAHCQEQAHVKAVLASAELINQQRANEIMGLIQDARRVRLDTDLGLSLYENAYERIIEDHEDIETYSTGINPIDKMIGHLRRREFGMVYAVSSGGKSLMLGNIAGALSAQKLNVVVITLELTSALYGRRMDAMIAGVPIGDHLKFASNVASYYENTCKEYGDIIIKKLPAGSTAADIESYLMDYEIQKGRAPDVMIIDYLGLMGVDGLRGNNNKFDIDHEKSIQLMRLGDIYNMIVISAGQINRDGYDVSKINPQHCAGGLSVINNSDWAFGLISTEEDNENNQVQVGALKIRNATRSAGNLKLYRHPQTLVFSENPTYVATTPQASPVMNIIDKKDEKPIASQPSSVDNTTQASGQMTSTQRLRSLLQPQ